MGMVMRRRSRLRDEQVRRALFQEAVAYSVREEGCANLADFLIRRSGMLYFDRDRIPEVREDVEGILEEYLGAQANVSEEFEREYLAVVRFKEQAAVFDL